METINEETLEAIKETFEIIKDGEGFDNIDDLKESLEK